MRTLFFAERFPPFPGGVAASAGRIVRTIAETWGPAEVLALDPSLPAGTLVAGGEPGDPVTRIGAAGSREATAATALRRAAGIAAEVAYGHFAGAAGFLAVFHARFAATPAGDKSRHGGIRSVVSVRGNDLDRGALGEDGFSRLLWTLVHADVVTAVTVEHARKASALAGREVRFTPNVVDPARFGPVPLPPGLRAELGLAAETETVGFSGELRPRKGQGVLLDALARLAAARPRLRLLLLGGVHPESRTAFDAAVRDRGLADRIRELPYRADPAGLAAHLAACQVLVFPSLADGLPNALLEAMACARPCVATAVGGAVDVIEEGRSGLLVPPADAPALAAALESLRADPGKARAIGEEARARVVRAFGPDREREDLRAIAGDLACLPLG